MEINQKSFSWDGESGSLGVDFLRSRGQGGVVVQVLPAAACAVGVVGGANVGCSSSPTYLLERARSLEIRR